MEKSFGEKIAIENTNENAQDYLKTIYEYENFVSKALKKKEAFYGEAQARGCDSAARKLIEWKERYQHEKNNSVYDLSGTFTGDRLRNRREGAAFIVR